MWLVPQITRQVHVQQAGSAKQHRWRQAGGAEWVQNGCKLAVIGKGLGDTAKEWKHELKLRNPQHAHGQQIPRHGGSPSSPKFVSSKSDEALSGSL